MARRTQEEKPQRIQRKRTKGWRMPENTVYVGRPTKWGNRYTVKVWGSHERAVSAFRAMCEDTDPEATGCAEFREQIKRELRGKNLACWCKEGQPCHADVLLEIANG